MPTYEYECEHCGHRFERLQPMSAPPVKTCPECGRRVRRLLSAAAGIVAKNRSCSLASGGPTCCGRSSPCGSPACGR